MKLFVIGATGRTGQEVVQQALGRGHQVTAFVRSPEGVGAKDERLALVKGDATDEDQLFNAMQNHDAVISTLGPRKVFKPGSLLYDSALATTRAMNRAGIKRLVVLSAAAHFPGIPNRIASFIMRNHMRDSLAMEKIVQSNGLDWTIARPPRLPREIRQPIEAGKARLPELASRSIAKRLRHSCSTPSNRRNICTRSWASRSNNNVRANGASERWKIRRMRREEIGSH